MTRGSIVRVGADRRARGHEQRGERYGVVLQADELALSTVLVAPTSTQARPASFRPQIELDGVRTRVCVEQTRALDRRRLGEPVATLGTDDLRAVDEALRIVLAV